MKNAYGSDRPQQIRELFRAGRFSEAIELSQIALEQSPDNTFVWLILAESHRALGDNLAALEAARALTRLLPTESWAAQLLGLLAKRVGQYQEAESAYRQALQLSPDDSEACCNLGAVLSLQGNHHGALECFKKALALAPDFAEAQVNLGVALAALGETEKAASAYRQVLAVNPKCSSAYANLANLEATVGASSQALDCLRKALEFNPRDSALNSGYLAVMARFCSVTPAQMRAASQAWEQTVIPKAELALIGRQYSSAPSVNNRKLHLGILSAEFGEHSVAWFLLPWLRELDRSKFEVTLFSTVNRQGDRVTDAFKAVADHWCSVVPFSDSQAVARIRAAKLDILLETTGHTVNNRLGIVARRVAPVQCHYIGYYATTGLSQMDYFIADDILVPPEHDAHFTETVWKLSRTRYSYQPIARAPEPRWSPDMKNILRLGSFNGLKKIDDDTLSLWAMVMIAVPNSILILKDPEQAGALIQQNIRARLQREGITGDRVHFLDRNSSWQAHMDEYNQIDIALDCLCFTSATTAFDALSMGTPLVTLAGDRLSSRQAASCLGGLKRSEWIARDRAGYVQAVLDLARNPELRYRLRFELPIEMDHSELCDHQGLARALEAAFIEMFDHQRATKRDVS